MTLFRRISVWLGCALCLLCGLSPTVRAADPAQSIPANERPDRIIQHGWDLRNEWASPVYSPLTRMIVESDYLPPKTASAQDMITIDPNPVNDTPTPPDNTQVIRIK